MSEVAEKAEVAWGYSMADLERLARAAVKRSPCAYRLDTEERYQTAWHGVIVALYGAASWPHHSDLIMGGLEALSRDSAGIRRNRGLTDQGKEAPNFAKYWRTVVDRSDGFTDQLVESMALPAVLGTLTSRQYHAIVALAAHDNNFQAAAESIGISVVALRERVRHARKRILVAWYGEETPPIRTKADTCRSGHSRADHGIRQANGAWTCQRCRRIAERRRRRAKALGGAVETAA